MMDKRDIEEASALTARILEELRRMELLKRLTQTDGVSGDESEIRAVIENEIKRILR